jgi:5-oxoprolinase (ATP-hydrolysing)
VGYALTTVWEGSEAGDQQVIGFDMGGTSTDVSRYAGSYEHVFESTTAGILQVLLKPHTQMKQCKAL